MFFRQLLNDATACASYLFGCKSKSKFAVVDPHVDLVDDYVSLAEAQRIPIVAVFETHVQADHVSASRRSSSAPVQPPISPRSGRRLRPHALADGEVVELGNTIVKASPRRATHPPTTPTSSPTYARGDDPWFALTGDSLLIGDAGRPDLHAGGERWPRRWPGCSTARSEQLLSLPDHVLLYPAHYSGSVCGRGLSATLPRRSASSAVTTMPLQSTPRTSSSRR